MPATRAMHIEDLEAQFLAISVRAKALVDVAGPQLSTQRASNGSWSVAECLEHLNISADSYFAVWPQAIAQAGEWKEAGEPYKIGCRGRLLAWVLEPPARFKTKTQKWFEPSRSLEVGPVLEGFIDRQQKIIGVLRSCRGRAVDEVKIVSPVDSRIRYSVWSSFVITAAHERRHLWQAEQAVNLLRPRQQTDALNVR